MVSITGTVELYEEWEPIPGTFFEIRGIGQDKDYEDLEYTADFGFSPTADPMKGVTLKLTKYGRVFLDVNVMPEHRAKGGIVADITHLNAGLITVRFGYDTPPPPPKPKPKNVGKMFTDPAESEKYYEWAQGSAARWEAMDDDERDAARVGTEGVRFMKNPPQPEPIAGAAGTWGSLLDEGNPDEWPEWLKTLKAEGYDTEDIAAVLDEDDGYTPRSARRTVDLSEEDWEDEKEMTEEEFQQYMARKAEGGR
jgi:hypothetical protein